MISLNTERCLINFKIFLLSILFCVSRTNAQTEEKTFKISYPSYIEIEKLSEIKKFLSECYSEVGINKVEYIQLPWDRSALELEKQTLDAEISRIKSTALLMKKNKNIPHVPVPLSTSLRTYISFLPEKKTQAKKIVSQKKFTDTKVTINLGFKATLNDRNNVNTEIVYVENSDQMAKLIESKRVDFSISLSDLTLKYPNLHKLIFSEDEILHILSPKHQELVPKLTQIFKRKLTAERRKIINNELISTLAVTSH